MSPSLFWYQVHWAPFSQFQRTKCSRNRFVNPGGSVQLQSGDIGSFTCASLHGSVGRKNGVQGRLTKSDPKEPVATATKKFFVHVCV